MAKYLCIWVRAYWFSVTSFSKWLPGGHIRFFGFWMPWFRQRNSSLLWNFSFKFHVHVLCGCRQKPNDCQLCRFQNGCLVILNNVQLQSTHCPPLLWGGGILVDHWSTISSFNQFIDTCVTRISGRSLDNEFCPRPSHSTPIIISLNNYIQHRKLSETHSYDL